MIYSRAGKEVLIKAITQFIPTYTMDFFCYWWSCVTNLMHCVLDFGGVKLETKKKIH